jgi:hypothetical protein
MNRLLRNITLAFAATTVLVFGIVANLHCSGCFVGEYVAEVHSCCSYEEKSVDTSDCCEISCLTTKPEVSYANDRIATSVPQFVATPISTAAFSSALAKVSKQKELDVSPPIYTTPRDYLSKLRVLII